LSLVAQIEEHAARHPGLALAGNAYRGVGVPQCVHSGEVAAEAVMRTTLAPAER
jgi:protoporphyrinogen/coproporphyrinogen III oxidase